MVVNWIAYWILTEALCLGAIWIGLFVAEHLS